MIKDTFYTLVPINRLLRMIALSNINRKGITVRTFRSITKAATYILVITVINLLFLYVKMIRHTHFINTTFINLLEVAYWFSHLVYIVDLYFAQKYGGDALIKYIQAFDAIDKTLTKTDYEGIHKMIIINVISGIGVFLFASIIDYVVWIYVHGWIGPSIFSIDYFCWFLNILTILDVVSQVIQVEFRLKIIQGLLQVRIFFCF